MVVEGMLMSSEVSEWWVEGLPADFKGGRGHRRELSVDSKDAIEFSVGKGGGYVGGDAGENSISLSAGYERRL